MSKSLKSDLLLLAITMCWGFSYLFMDRCLEDMGTFTLNTYRFLGAFAVAFALSFKRLLHVNRITIKYAALLGVALLGVYTFVSYGIQFTTLSNSGFLCALAVVFVPIFKSIRSKTLPSFKFVLVVVICVIGIAFLTLADDFTINRETLKGDILCILCSVAYALHIIITESALTHEDVDAYQLGVYQLGFMGLLCLILAFTIETPTLPSTPAVWGQTVMLAVLCTGVAFIIQTIAQRNASATRVGVIFCMEPVFAGLVAYFFAGETLSVKSYIGAALIIAAILIMEIDFKKKHAAKELDEHEEHA